MRRKATWGARTAMVAAVATTVMGLLGGTAAAEPLTDPLTETVTETVTEVVNPLAAWEAALADAGTNGADVLVVGDSISEGYWAESRERWWIDQLRRRLQADYGGAGLGYLRVVGSDLGLSPFEELWTYGGGTASVSGLGDRAYAITTPAGFAQVTVEGSHLQLSYATSPTTGAMRILIDGQPAATIDTYAAGATTSGRTWSSPDLGAGTHTLRVEPDTGGQLAVASVVVEGVEVSNGRPGVHVWDATHAGYSSWHFLNSASFADTIAQTSPDLVVLELGSNDLNYSISAAAFQANLAALIDTITANAGQAPSVVLAPVWRLTSHSAAAHQAFVAVQQELAALRGLGIADASAVDALRYTADGAHPNQPGEDILADVVLRAVDPAYGTAVPAPAGPADDPLLVGPHPVPTAPGATTATPESPSSARVSWTAPTDGSGPLGVYLVEAQDRSVAGGAVVRRTTAATTTVLAGLTPGRTYDVAVRVQNTAGTSAPAPIATVVMPGPPPSPTDVTAVAGSALGTADVTWTAPVGTVDRYVVQAYNMTTSTLVNEVTVSSPAASFSGLTPGHSYAFLIFPGNEFGYGPPAGSNTIALPTAPGAVTALTATAGATLGTATVSWTPPAGPVDRYVVKAVDTVLNTVAAQQTVTSSPASFTGLTAGRSYRFTVAAENGYGVGPTATSAVLTLPTLPGAVTKLTATTAGPGAAKATWTAPAGTVDSYRVQLLDTARNVVVGEKIVTTTTATFTGLTRRRSYAFIVPARNIVGYGPTVKSKAVTVT